MSAHYKLVHFAPDPLSGWRVPIGALVSETDKVRFVEGEWTPGPACIGGVATSAVLRMIVAAIAKSPDYQRLPVQVGPQAALSAPIEIPSSVEDPIGWVKGHVLPGRPAANLPEREYGPRRDVVGRRFFEQYRVDRWLKRRFNPESLATGMSPLSASEITHYVTGSDEILLMEPLVGSRANFEKEISEVSQLFLAWRQLFEEVAQNREPRFIAYAFPYGRNERVDQVRDVLEAHRFEVVNVDTPSERTGLLDSVNRIGASGERLGNI